MATKRKKTVSETLRAAVGDCGDSLAEVARQTGIDVGNLSRFVRGERGLSVENLDILAEYLNLELVSRKAK
jgi:transcriptional regulator with XRE-family HTH domain